MAQRMILAAAIFLAGLASGCVTPSTLLVNREGKIMRCAAHGWGNAIAIGTAEQIHDSCVRDARLVGFIPLPQTGLGVHFVKDPPLSIVRPEPNAYAAGVREGDILIELDSKPIKEPFSLMQILNTKKPGDRVGMKVQRGGSVLPLTVELIRREDMSP